MAGRIIMWIVTFGCGILFFSIGIYARRITKPMWFWSDGQVDSSKISDIAQYNRDNGIMWQRYCLWYFAAGIAEFWDPILAVLCLVLACTVGIGMLVRSYNRISKKYQVQE